MENSKTRTLQEAISAPDFSKDSQDYIIINMPLNMGRLSCELTMCGDGRLLEFGLIEAGREVINKLYEGRGKWSKPVISRRRTILKAGGLVYTLGLLSGAILAKLWWGI